MNYTHPLVTRAKETYREALAAYDEFERKCNMPKPPDSELFVPATLEILSASIETVQDCISRLRQETTMHPDERRHYIEFVRMHETNMNMLQSAVKLYKGRTE